MLRLGEAAAGFYYLAFMMSNLLYSIAYALNQSVLAEGAYEELSFRTLVKKSATAVAASMIPASALLAALGPFVLRLFGTAYAASTRPLLYAFAASGPFVAAYILGISMLRLKKMERETIIANGFYACSIIGMTLLWASKGLGWIGGAWLVGNLTTGILIAGLYRRGLRSRV